MIPVVRTIVPGLETFKITKAVIGKRAENCTGYNQPIVFLGPTLSRDVAIKILDADYREPAKKGDF